MTTKKNIKLEFNYKVHHQENLFDLSDQPKNKAYYKRKFEEQQDATVDLTKPFHSSNVYQHIGSCERLFSLSRTIRPAVIFYNISV